MELTAIQALQRGVAAHKAGKPHEAEKFYRAILNSQPQLSSSQHDRNLLAETYTNLGVALQQRGDLEGAIQHYQQAVKIRPEYAEVYSTMGLAFRNKGDARASIDCYQQVVKLRPNSADAFNNLGAALQNNGELVAAIDSYERALQLDPNCAEAYNNMGIAHQANDDMDSALDAYRRALKLQPNYVNAHNNMGNVLSDKGELEDALACYENALRLEPNSPLTHNNLGNTLRSMENYEEALRHFDFNTAIEANPSNPQFWYNSISQALECLYMLGRYSELKDRLQALGQTPELNLRVAAVSAFVSHQLDFEDPYPFCKKPLDYVHIGNLQNHVADVGKFTEGLIREAEKENQVWEPLHGVTKGGYQTSNTIFKAGENCKTLERLLHGEIASYQANFKSDACAYTENWPTKYDLRGWYARLIKGGHQTPHNHPSGWLSGVVYLKTVDSAEGDDGAIELGLHGHNLTILDADYPRKIHRPSQGDIVLFPSSLFHRTIPFSQDAERCVIAFDLYRY